MAESVKDLEQARAHLARANEELAKAQERAAEAGQQVSAAVTRGVPQMKVKVLKNNVVSYEGKTYEEGKEFKMEGPTAIAFVQMGHVEITGTA